MRFFFYVFFCAVCFLSGGGCEGEGLIERDGEMSGIGVCSWQGAPDEAEGVLIVGVGCAPDGDGSLWVVRKTKVTCFI